MLRRQIVAQAEGTPLFLEEISRALLETGLVVRDPGHLRAVQEVTIPASVQAVVASRMDRLPPSQRSLLQIASVIGREVSVDLLRRVAGVLEDRLRADLAGLTRAEFLYEIVLPSAIEYIFKHALTQAVAYDGMLRRHRRELHARVFAALHASAADRIGEFTDLLAAHAFRGELWDEAATFAHRAGLRANGRSAWPEAVAFFERAIEALAHLPAERAVVERGIETRMSLRVALGALGDFERIRRCIDDARELAISIDDHVRVAQTDSYRCIVLGNLGRLDEAINAGHSSRAAAMRAGDGPSFLNATFGLGQALWFRGEFAEAERTLTQALPHVAGTLRLHRASTSGTPSVLNLVCLSKTYAMTGRFAQASQITRQALEIAEESALPYDRSYARVAEGFLHLMRRAHGDAIASLEQALAISRAANVRLLHPSVARYLGRAYAHVARHEEARTLLDEAMR